VFIHAKCNYTAVRVKARVRGSREFSTTGYHGERNWRGVASPRVVYTPVIYLPENNTHGRTSGLTKSDDFSNACVKEAIVGDCEQHRTTDNVPRARRTILHAGGGSYARKIAEMHNLRFKVVDQGPMINAVIETLT